SSQPSVFTLSLHDALPILRTKGVTMSEPLVFLDVDTQVDFMLPTGSLYVPGAEQIIPHLKKLMNSAREHAIPVLSSADAHAPDRSEEHTSELQSRVDLVCR